MREKWCAEVAEVFRNSAGNQTCSSIHIVVYPPFCNLALSFSPHLWAHSKNVTSLWSSHCNLSCENPLPLQQLHQPFAACTPRAIGWRDLLWPLQHSHASQDLNRPWRWRLQLWKDDGWYRYSRVCIDENIKTVVTYVNTTAYECNYIQ